MYVICQVSGRFFGGYKYICNIDEFTTLEEISDKTKMSLINNLTLLNLEDLITIARDLNFHIHSTTISEVIEKKNNIIYVCTHC